MSLSVQHYQQHHSADQIEQYRIHIINLLLLLIGIDEIMDQPQFNGEAVCPYMGTMMTPAGN